MSDESVKVEPLTREQQIAFMKGVGARREALLKRIQEDPEIMEFLGRRFHDVS